MIGKFFLLIYILKFIRKKFRLTIWFSWKPIEEYIDKQFNLYYQHETGYGTDRKKLQDTRIHCCLYFIPPYVRGYLSYNW